MSQNLSDLVTVTHFSGPKPKLEAQNLLYVYKKIYLKVNKKFRSSAVESGLRRKNENQFLNC